MCKENIENFLAEPDNEYSAVETHKPTKNRFADQEMQVGMAGPYTAKIIWRHSQASPRVGIPRVNEAQEDQRIHGEERYSRRPK